MSIDLIKTSTLQDERIVPCTRISLHAITEWYKDAKEALVGREVIRTGDKDDARGEVCRITDVYVARGASGFHMFLRAPSKHGDEHGKILLELGVSCALVKKDDVPDALL